MAKSWARFCKGAGDEDSTEGKLLPIFVGEADRWDGLPLHKAIVLEAKKADSRALRRSRGSWASAKLDAMVKEGLITLEKVQVVVCRVNGRKP